MNDTTLLDRYVRALRETFRTVSDKREAHHRSRPILADMAGDATVLGAMLARHLMQPAALNRGHYPVVSIEIEHNAYYTLVANCWIPLPDRATDVSTKSIHHHGSMLLTTATGFGPGYEHWTFTRPEPIDADAELYSMKLIERAAHPRSHIDFVDAFIGHCPLYPSALSVTFALWSNSVPTTWRDVVKRLPLLKGHEETLRRLAARVGLARALDLKMIEYFDFYPAQSGFKGMKERQEFSLGPNEDYLYSLFHIIQGTGNESLAPRIAAGLSDDRPVTNASLVRTLLHDLTSGHPIDGRLSACHYNLPYANFSSSDIERALGPQRAVPNESGA